MRWKAIVAALVLFFAGVLSGVMGQRLINARQHTEGPPKRPFPGGPPMPWIGQRMNFMERLTKDLELTPDQAAKIDTLIKASQQRLRELWKPVAPKARQEMTNIRAAISAVLTPEQRMAMEELFKRHGPGHRGSGRFRPPSNESESRHWEGRRRGDQPPGPPPGKPGPAPEPPPGERPPAPAPDQR